MFAFTVSASVTAHHCPARKPFNPILGETYEWIREDKGVRFFAEQVRVCTMPAEDHCSSDHVGF